MNAADDEAMGQGLHGVGKDVSGNGLGTIFYEFGPVAFNTAPFSCGRSFIGHGLAAELVLLNSRLDIAQPSAGGKGYEKHSALTALLAQDPRPAYQDDPDRIYGLSFADINLKFKVSDGVLHVLAVER